VAAFHSDLLDLRRMEMLRRCRLRPRGAAEGSFAGPHKSHFRGTAVEFADYRDYVPGDDIRLLDWKLLARSDKRYVRCYESERNLLSYLVLDSSGSMAFSGECLRTESKLRYASRLLAALAYLVVEEGDEVGLSCGDAGLGQHLPAGRGFTHLALLARQLDAAKAQGRTDLGACLHQIFGRSRQRGVLVICSDFLTDEAGLWRSLDLFRASRFDVLLLHIVHPEELDLPDVPLARFTDPEGGNLRFDSDPALLRAGYRERMQRFLNQIEGQALSRGCAWSLARCDQDPYLFLRRCLMEREALG
jgi:uncharacterized protein (DUF58 family)